MCFRHHVVVGAVSLGGVGLSFSPAGATVSAFTFAGVSNPGDFPVTNTPSTYALFDNQSDGHPIIGTPLTIDVDESFTGMDRSESSRTMRFQVDGRAEAQYQRLRNRLTLSVDNFFYSPEQNAPYYDPTTNITNVAGVPDTFAAETLTRASERLIYGGTATNYTSRFYLMLEGTIAGDGGYATVLIQHGTNPAERINIYNLTGDFLVPIVSSAYVNSANTMFSITLQVGVMTGTLDYLEDGDSYYAHADFGNTLTLVGIEARDDNGVLLEPGSITGESSGLTYAIVAPEPGTLAAFAATAVLARRRRR